MQIRHVDLFLLPFIVVQPYLAVPYLLAKGTAEAISWAFDTLEYASESELQKIFFQKNSTSFCAAAARINLGFLLAGGGVAIGVLGVGPLVSYALDMSGTDFSKILLWLVLGQCAPVLFGATHLLMDVANMRSVFHFLLFVTCPIMACAMFIQGEGDPVAIAKVMAIFHLGFAAMCAFVLGYVHGVLPGLTAILYQRIRLL